MEQTLPTQESNMYEQDHNPSTHLLSVVTPVYNPPLNNLRRCAQSILEQPYSSIEWILADDGSKPEVLEVLQELAESDKRVRLLRLSHGGASKARNVALEHATGNLVTFVDADDEVTPVFFSHAIGLLSSTNADVALGLIEHVATDATRHAPSNTAGTQSRVLEGNELSDFLRFLISSRPVHGEDYCGVKPGSIAPRVYKRTLINNTRFYDDMTFAEDCLFGYEVIVRARRVAIVDEVWYCYVSNPTSATNGITPQKYERHLESVSLLCSRAIERNCAASDVALKCATALQALSFELAVSVSFAQYMSIFCNNARRLRPIMGSLNIEEYELSSHARYLYGSLSRGRVIPAALLLWAKGMKSKKG